MTLMRGDRAAAMHDCCEERRSYHRHSSSLAIRPASGRLRAAMRTTVIALTLAAAVNARLVTVTRATSQDAAAITTAQAEELRAILNRATRLPLQRSDIRPAPPSPGWEMGMVSWIAGGRDGLVYMLQRGDKADPVVVMNRDGKVVRSWGK